jgi:SOS response regulatory protein OraA/RecX
VIRFDLAGRGVDAETIEEALAGIEPERERAVRLVERLGATVKTAAQLRRKGFSEESLAGALRQVGSEL